MLQPRVGRGVEFRRPTARAVALTIYFVLLAAFIVRFGWPFDRSLQMLWLLAGMSAAQVGRPLSQWLRMLRDWLPFFAALLVYDYTRGVSDTMGRPVLVEGLVDAERWITGGVIPTVWLQDHFYDPFHVHWYDAVASVVYASHFVVPWALAAILYVVSRDVWVGYARRVLTLTFAGLLTYALLPAAPPWYADQAGLIDGGVERIATRGWSEIGLHTAGRLLAHAQADVNLVAALPSLHAGTAMLVALWALPYLHAWWSRLLMLAYPVAMGLTLIYAGEHYLVDVLMGWGYAVATVMACTAWERWRSSRRVVESAYDAAGGVDVVRPHEHA